MSEKQGYFSLIQYSEFPERNEFVNIGLVVFSKPLPHVIVKFSASHSRVRKAFGRYPGKHFEFEKQSMEDRLVNEFEASWDKSNIERFIGLRSGKIRMSAPKSLLIEADPRAIADDLFERLVEPIEFKERIQKVQTKLKNELALKGVERLLEKPEPVPLPQGVEIKAQYAYQNGSYNLISAISLRDDPNLALAAASKQAVEGLWLSELREYQRRLIVVGDVENQQQNFVVAVKDMMEKNSVSFYPLSEIDPLADDIRRNVNSALSVAGTSSTDLLN